jgi:glycerophosphoryl diester phosphodiesterase
MTSLFGTEGGIETRPSSPSSLLRPSFSSRFDQTLFPSPKDLGLTKDGHLVVWHDENIVATKCKDTAPAFEGDEQFPYVGQFVSSLPLLSVPSLAPIADYPLPLPLIVRFVANLTLAQVKTLDCGSLRENNFPLQLVVPS